MLVGNDSSRSDRARTFPTREGSMNPLLKRSGILVIGLSAAACAERTITDPPRAKDVSGIGPSFTVLPGAQVVVNFEPLSAGIWYVPGPIHGQDDWSSLGANGSGCALYDHQVVVNPAAGTSYSYADFALQSLRLSNAVTSGCFGDQTFSKRLDNAAGEMDADGGGYDKVPGPRRSHFEAQWDFASTVPDAEQPDLSVVASPDRGDGARMSWVQMLDKRNGIDINFFDVRGTSDPAHFVGPTGVISNLDRRVPHTIRITMDFFDGPSNDVVKVYVDGSLKHIGTSWENYYRYDSEAAAHAGKTPIVNRILFRTGGAAAIGNMGKGFVIDNFSMKSADGPTSESQCKNDGWQSFDWFTNQGECMQYVNMSS
jgi:hypothetical protein